MEEEDFFSDDDLENIPDDTLQELEQNAWSSTQKQPVAAVPLLRKQAHNASSLNRSTSFKKNLPWRPPQRSQPQSRPGSAAAQANAHAHAVVEAAVPDEYGLDDEVVIDLNDTSVIVPLHAHAETENPRFRRGTRSPPDSQTDAAYSAADAQLAHELLHQPGRPGRSAEVDVAVLQAKIVQLEAEQTRLRRAAQEARNAALAKQGEIAIVRSNQEKANREHERRIAALQKHHAEQTAQHRAELDVRGKEMEKMQTDNRFLQHEAAQGNSRSRHQAAHAKPRTAPASRETPRKSRIQTLGDGFDNGDVRKVSPSRNRDKSREATPTKAGIKRKRGAPDSPSLSFARSLRHESSENMQSFSDPFVMDDDDAYEEAASYEFMHHIFSHPSPDGRISTIEALSKYSFPSVPDRSLSSLFMDEASRRFSVDIEQMPLHAYRALLRLWERCLREKYFAPFSLILSLLRFVLLFELSDFVSKLIEEVVPLCCRSIDLITVEITKAAKYPDYEQQVDWQAQEKLAQEMDSVEVLEFLLFLCHAASISADRNERFWRCIEGSFLLTLLSNALPISHITPTLRMLQTSATATTFGPTCDDHELQAKQELGTVERLTHLLFNVPKPAKDEPPYSDEEITEFRLGLLQVLQHMCLTDHGSMLIATHRSAIGRLIRFLDGQLCKLYETRPSLGMSQVSEGDVTETPAHGLVVQTVNLTTRIFYHVIRTNDSSIDIVQKLNMVHGGYHKFLVSLTRIAFSEQLVFEAGIEDEVITAAHTILDNLLSPEDGEAVLKAIETPRGTRGSATEKDLTSGEMSEQEDEDTMMSDGMG